MDLDFNKAQESMEYFQTIVEANQKNFKVSSHILATPHSSRIQKDTAKGMDGKSFWPKAEKIRLGTAETEDYG